ncbi:hypothetical protein T484DRAFT_1923380 [Baffinella frigidus]|nr:hypothetical protein T484DRAFT_1923380 [Cryptophyta sp. CCMP2293]
MLEPSSIRRALEHTACSNRSSATASAPPCGSGSTARTETRCTPQTCTSEANLAQDPAVSTQSEATKVPAHTTRPLPSRMSTTSTCGASGSPAERAAG